MSEKRAGRWGRRLRMLLGLLVALAAALLEPVTPEGRPAAPATAAWWRAPPPLAPRCPEPAAPVATAAGSAMNRAR